MRKVFSEAIEQGREVRARIPYSTLPGDRYGAFKVACPTGAILTIIACSGDQWVSEGMPGEPWDHVSVSLPGRTPTWAEMCWVKDEFFEAEECVMQLHPPKSQYVDCHRHTLHLWKPTVPIPMPPRECV
jgi:hypothetical protein